MMKPMRVLLVEDSEDDALLLVRELKKGGYDPEYGRVETAEAMRAALRERSWDVILCDFRLPRFDGLAAVALLKEIGIDIPLIIVSGAIGEETAADCMRCGADDYVMKGNLSRLVPAIERELKEAESRVRRKRAEEELRESEKKYRVIAENMTDVISIVDMNMRFTFISPSIMRLRGFTVDEAMGQSLEQVMTPQSLLLAYKTYEEESQLESRGTADPGRDRTIELEEYRKDRSTIWVEVNLSFLRDADGRPIGILSLTRDIDARKRAEEALRDSEERYRELIRYAPAGIYEVDYEANRFISVNDIVCEYTGYTRDELLTMNPFNLLTEESQTLMIARLEKLTAGEKIVPTVEYCIRTKDGNELWALLNARYIYEAGKLKGATGVIYNITDRKRAEEQLRESLEQVRRAMQTTIQVLVMAVEVKDPYTAGHQRRMTALARTMATEMGLSPEKIEGLRMAGVIHDIGKITLPTELLSKPMKLSAIELSLVREHVRLGYDILKDVESPWPLAEIVLQHHERMNGSGYPRGLKAEEILIEARILAVADVVEAMASHRPYRPALGLEAALEEIEKNRGSLYDGDAADACLTLFREEGYQLDGV
jgi:PAS domain S-box-containing protein